MLLCGFEQYTDVYLNINVETNSNLTIINQDVISEVHISLLDALTGTTTITDTINRSRICSNSSKI